MASRRGHELLGLVACAATGLLVSPISWSHHYVYVVPALVLAAYGPRRLGYRILGAALVVGLFGWWPLPTGNQGGYDPQRPAHAARVAASRAERRQRRSGSRVHLARTGIDRRQLLRAHHAGVYRGHRMRPGAYPR